MYKIKNFFKRKQIKIEHYILLFSLVNFLIFSWTFLLKLIDKGEHFLFNFSFILLAFSLVHLVSLLFLPYKKTTKFFASLLFVINSLAFYFSTTYNVALNSDMLTNLFETNLSESIEFINVKLFIYVLFLGILPSIYFTKFFTIEHDKSCYKSLLKQLLSIIILVVFNLSTSIILPKYFYHLKKNRKLSTNLIPINYISSSMDVLFDKITKVFTSNEIKNISENAIFNDTTNKKNLIVFVIGESARADNFSINNYSRNTNKYLENEDLVNFSNFYSCGTATFVSVPCLFSHFDRKNFSVKKGRKYENIVDIFKKVGFDVYWKTNNGNCKNVCDRINFSSLDTGKNDDFDGHFIDYLDDKIQSLNSKNNFIILHTRGNHGPLYSKRYPKEFEIFTPVCDSSNVDDCKYEELVNAYDNAIHYTSYVIERLIDVLKKNSDEYNSVLFYVSDHGESLGENKQFMHGSPYTVANNFQKHVPFFFWLSTGFEKDFNIDKQCLKNKSSENFSHDNIFHSLLGAVGIVSPYYDDKLDIFKGCREK